MKWEGFVCDICRSGPYDQAQAVIETTTIEADGEKRAFRREVCRECGSGILQSVTEQGMEVTRRPTKTKAAKPKAADEVVGI